ncbi:DUF4433 domain-containing protein [bacterium]|nr:MAG: DUF4433 domain-containing protein [bacterium]
MPRQIPDKVWIYRIIHIDNVEYLLTHGMFTRHHKKADSNYINIGDTELIVKRNTYNVKVNPPNGLLGDYVPFYFGPLSPMLLKIKDGNGGIMKRPQKDIIYIVCKLDDIIDYCPHWCFTDGHAKTAITEFYNNIAHLDQVDWNIVRERYWRNTDDDFDRMRKKQAEFLVKSHVPVNCIKGIVTYNEAAKNAVQEIVTKLNLSIKVITNYDYYY